MFGIQKQIPPLIVLFCLVSQTEDGSSNLLFDFLLSLYKEAFHCSPLVLVVGTAVRTHLERSSNNTNDDAPSSG